MLQRAELPVLYAKLSQGAISAEEITRFERIGREAKVDRLAEGGIDLGGQVAAWRKQLPAGEKQ